VLRLNRSGRNGVGETVALTVQLRWTLIDERIAATGGAMALQARSGLNRSTISRWRKGVLPNDPLHFLELARALDVDPFLLFDLQEAGFGQTCRQVGSLLLAGRLTSALRSLSFIQDYYRQTGAEWPPESLESSSGAFHYRWTTREFVHTGQLGSSREERNFYASVLLRGPRADARAAPQVWHFAYRDRMQGPTLWRPYGTVALVGDRLELYAFHGEKVVADAKGPVAVETWFGEGDAHFRVASLHGFSLDVARTTPPGHSMVRFSLPRFRVAQ
jgi:hypothetical protein